MSQHRADVSVYIPLPESVNVSVLRIGGSTMERVDGVEWTAEAQIGHGGEIYVRVQGLARGVYAIWTHFSPENAPEWAPAPPASLAPMARNLLKEVML